MVTRKPPFPLFDSTDRARESIYRELALTRPLSGTLSRSTHE